MTIHADSWEKSNDFVRVILICWR